MVLPPKVTELGLQLTVPPSAGLAVGSGFVDPKSFLLAVMNDTSASARHRIAAAKALLPCFADKPAN